MWGFKFIILSFLWTLAYSYSVCLVFTVSTMPDHKRNKKKNDDELATQATKCRTLQSYWSNPSKSHKTDSNGSDNPGSSHVSSPNSDLDTASDNMEFIPPEIPTSDKIHSDSDEQSSDDDGESSYEFNPSKSHKTYSNDSDNPDSSHVSSPNSDLGTASGDVIKLSDDMEFIPPEIPTSDKIHSDSDDQSTKDTQSSDNDGESSSESDECDEVTTDNESETEATVEDKDVGRKVKSRVELYHGFPYDIHAIQRKVGAEVLQIYHEKMGKKTRVMVKCLTCREYEEEARKFSGNGIVYLAHGVRCEGEVKLERVIDHLSSNSHTEAERQRELSRKWKNHSETHPWIRVVKNLESKDIERLVNMFLHVYNDSKTLTLAAWSYPGRSLTEMAADSISKQISEHGFDVELKPFEPTSSQVQYLNPIMNAEMLKYIAEVEIKKLRDEIENCICFSIQSDGSVDKKQRDKKYMTLRLNHPSDPCNVVTKFIGLQESEVGGAAGVLDCLKEAMTYIGLSREIVKSKLIGITTDGASENTGHNQGFWQLVMMWLERPVLTVWCVCHRSDLAEEDMEKNVDEVVIWKSNLTGLSAYYRKSGKRTKALKRNGGKKAFPAHHEVRFAEHTSNLITAVIANVDSCRKHWEEIQNDRKADKKEKAKATGFLKTWQEDSLQMFLTVLMSDVMDIFRELQKHCQKENLILPDVIKYRNQALQKLELINSGPYPGGQEKVHIEKHETNEPKQSGRKVSNSLVTTNRRDYQAVRTEIVQGAINFLSQRLDIEQEQAVEHMINLLKAKTVSAFIEAAKPLFKVMPPSFSQTEFVSEAIADFEYMKPEGCIREDEYTVRLYKMLRESKGSVRLLLSSQAVVCPHSMTVERVVSYHNIIKSNRRESLELDTLNNRLYISLNGKSTSEYDPRPAIIRFLTKKDRRQSNTSVASYKTQDFVKKFFDQ